MNPGNCNEIDSIGARLLVDEMNRRAKTIAQLVGTFTHSHEEYSLAKSSDGEFVAIRARDHWVLFRKVATCRTHNLLPQMAQRNLTLLPEMPK